MNPAEEMRIIPNRSFVNSGRREVALMFISNNITFTNESFSGARFVLFINQVSNY